MDDPTSDIRQIRQILPATDTIEGAGVHLRRAFGHSEAPRLDPFLLLDDFRSENPAEYVAGFPWHPHRGIETVTYMLDGRVDHEDSLGNKGAIGAGDLQWMTAGSGIIHQEMPKGTPRRMGCLQLWVNLPARQKMRTPRYQEVRAANVPIAQPTKGARVKVISGSVAGVQGPIRELEVDPTYFDVQLEPHTTFQQPIAKGHTTLAYVLDGEGRFDAERGEDIPGGSLALFGDGDRVEVRTDAKPARFLLIAGKPLHEPVAWWGPIVMNDRRELETAVQEFREGTFIKHRAAA